MLNNRNWAVMAVIAATGCASVKRDAPNMDPAMEHHIGDVQNFSLEAEDSEYEIPESYQSRFDGKFSDIGDRTPVKDYIPKAIDEIAEPDIDFIEHNHPEEAMAMFGDTDETKRVFYVKTATATVYQQADTERKPIKVLKKGQRIKASLENGWAKIGKSFYMSLENLSLTPVTTIRAAKRSAD